MANRVGLRVTGLLQGCSTGFADLFEAPACAIAYGSSAMSCDPFDASASFLGR